MDRVEEILSTPPVAPLIGFAALLLLALWILNTAARPAPKQAGLRSWLRANYWLAMVLAGLSLGGVAAIFYLVEIGISVRAIVDRLVLAASDPTTDAEDLRNLATATAVLLAALAAAATLVFQLVRVWVTERQTTTAEQNLITDRINQAVAGLGAEKVLTTTLKDPGDQKPLADKNGAPAQFDETLPNIEVRVGAILSLERISQYSPDDHVRVMEILCAYVRENACIVSSRSYGYGNQYRQRTDSQLALTVIGRRSRFGINLEKEAGYRLDLRGADLRNSAFGPVRASSVQGASHSFSRAILDHSLLDGSWLGFCDFREATMAFATLREVQCQQTDFSRAELGKAKAKAAFFADSNFTDATLHGCDFTNASLDEAVGLTELQKRQAITGDRYT